MHSLIEATLPLGPVEGEEDTHKAFVLASRVSALSNEAPSLFDEEDCPPIVAEPLEAGAPKEHPAVPITLPSLAKLSDASTLEQHAVVPVSPSKVAEPSNAGTPKRPPNVPDTVARKVTHGTLVD